MGWGMTMEGVAAVGLAGLFGWTAGAGLHRVIRRYCEAERGPVQALAAAGCAMAAMCASGMALIAAIALVLWCVCLSVIDLHTMRLPNPLTGVGAVGVGLVAAASGRWPAAAVGAGLLAGLYLLGLVLAVAAGNVGFGGGDVKLAVGLGGATGMAGGQVWLWAAVGALVLTAAAGLWRRRRRGGAGARGLGGQLPHGPSMCLASLISLGALG